LIWPEKATANPAVLHSEEPPSAWHCRNVTCVQTHHTAPTKNRVSHEPGVSTTWRMDARARAWVIPVHVTLTDSARWRPRQLRGRNSEEMPQRPYRFPVGRPRWGVLEGGFATTNIDSSRQSAGLSGEERSYGRMGA
jgi:hypothetical protein